MRLYAIRLSDWSLIDDIGETHSPSPVSEAGE
jgi:hypothetical protein